MDIYLLLFGIVVMAAALAAGIGLRARSVTQAEDQSAVLMGGRRATLEEMELSRPFFERAVKPSFLKLLAFLSRLSPQRNVEELQHKLDVAGRPYGWTPVTFLGLRLFCAIICGIVFFLLLGLSELELPARLLLAVVFALLGLYVPVIWLGRLMGQRKNGLLRALPDGLDMLNVCVGAGLGFDAALSRVSDYWQSVLSDEFNRIVLEMRLGKTRRQALLDFADRTEVSEVEAFVSAIVQADQLGVSVAKVLHTQAEQMRIFRRQRAEELARKASIKMLFPLVFLIFPALLAVLLGPAIPQILNAFADLGR